MACKDCEKKAKRRAADDADRDDRIMSAGVTALLALVLVCYALARIETVRKAVAK